MADPIYVGQVLTISLDTTISLAGASSPVIRAISPTGAVYEWPASVSGTSLEYTTVKDTDLNMYGEWKLQAVPHIEGADAPGKTVRMVVRRMGT